MVLTGAPMTRAQELVVLRRLHSSELAVNAAAGGSKKGHVSTSTSHPATATSSSTAEEAKDEPVSIMGQLRAKVDKQGDLVKAMKLRKASKEELKEPVALLLALKEQLKEENERMQGEANAKKAWRSGLESICLRKFFYVPAFEIYGGVAGLYDYGPPGCLLKSNLLSLWRKHFVLEENMLEISSTTLTPECVLKTSGHVDKFTDFMCKDVKTGDCYRADKILEDHMDDMIAKGVSAAKKAELLQVRSNADAYSCEELKGILNKYGVKSPDTGNDLTDPFAFNLMFGTQIGPTGKLQGYMRPETAQGIFVNFRRLLEYNSGSMPFAAAQIGLAFRNEISPRSGLLRVREFQMAEIEHFVDPDNKDHSKFANYKDYKFLLLSKTDQTGEDISRLMAAGEAVKKGVINNETLAYFMVRTHMFLLKCGIQSEKLRFRQHKATEMAHYASDCWDAEIHMSYGWIECVGLADRAAYDLRVHTAASKTELIAQKTFDTPVIEEVVVWKLNHGILGHKFKKQAPAIVDYLKELSIEDAMKVNADLDQGPVTLKTCQGEFVIDRDMAEATKTSRKVSSRKFIPSVVEPSFGIGRIIYGILEHSYTEVTQKNGEKECMLRISPYIAPYKVAILPLTGDPQLAALVGSLESSFIAANLTSKIDTSGVSIGRKYARADEIGVPFAVTLDPATLENRSVTVRDRDSTLQVRVPLDKVVGVVQALVAGKDSWANVRKQWPHFSA